MHASNSPHGGATAVITHRVRDGMRAEYDAWLEAIGPVCRGAPGHLDWQIIRPIATLTGSYTVVTRFDTVEHLRGWMESEARKRFIEQVRPLLEANDDYSVHEGLDFWFLPQGALARPPVRWKQFLVTWSAIYPLVLGAPLLLGPVVRGMGLPQHVALDTLLSTASIVALMVYAVMPTYTRLVRNWLFA